jgi:hypothetical protein
MVRAVWSGHPKSVSHASPQVRLTCSIRWALTMWMVIRDHRASRIHSGLVSALTGVSAARLWHGDAGYRSPATQMRNVMDAARCRVQPAHAIGQRFASLRFSSPGAGVTRIRLPGTQGPPRVASVRSVRSCSTILSTPDAVRTPFWREASWRRRTRVLQVGRRALATRPRFVECQLPSLVVIERRDGFIGRFERSPTGTGGHEDVAWARDLRRFRVRRL